MSNAGAKVRPAKKFIELSGKCSNEGARYGECILRNYSTISKGQCEQEFSRFKQCVQKHMLRKW